MDKTIEYIKEIEPEMRWHHDELLVFFYKFQVEYIMETLSEDVPSVFDDGGLQVWMKDGYIVMDMAYIADYCGEDAEKILPRSEKERS